MNLNVNKSIDSGFRRWLVLWVGVFLILAGCTSVSSVQKKTQRMVRNFKDSGAFKKKVAVTVFENKTFLTPGEFESVFQNNTPVSVKNSCPEILLTLPGDPGYPELLLPVPVGPSGRIDNFEVAQIGRARGLNAVVAGGLTNITAFEEERGFLWFKDIYYFVNIQLYFEIYDTETGAKLFNENFIREVEIDEIEYESIKAGTLKNVDTVVEAIKKITASMGEKMCDAIARQPWNGFVVSVEGKKIVLSSGREVGFKEGDELAVFDSGDIIEGTDGQRFFLPGLKTGKIRITAVGPENAEAVILSRETVKVGSTVKPE